MSILALLTSTGSIPYHVRDARGDAPWTHTPTIERYPKAPSLWDGPSGSLFQSGPPRRSWGPPLPEPVARYSLVGVVLVLVALMRVVRVGVVLMLVALVHVVHVTRLAVVLVLVALVRVVLVSVVLVLVALVLVVPVAVSLAVVLVLVRVVLVLVALVLVVHVARLAVMLVLVALMRDVGCLYHQILLTCKHTSGFQC